MKKLFVGLMMVCVAGCVEDRNGVAGEAIAEAPEICGISMGLPQAERAELIIGRPLKNSGSPTSEGLDVRFGGMGDYYSDDYPNRLTGDGWCYDTGAPTPGCVKRYTMVLVPISDKEYGICFIRETVILEGEELTLDQIYNMSQLPSSIQLPEDGSNEGTCIVRGINKITVGDGTGPLEIVDGDREHKMVVAKCGGPWTLNYTLEQFKTNQP